MNKQITITGSSKAELLEEALEVVELLSGAPAAATTSTPAPDGEGEDEAPKRTKKPRVGSKKTKKTAGPTKDQLRDAVQAAIDAHGEEPVKEVFKKHKAKKFSDFKEAQFAAVMADLKVLEELAEEEEDEDEGLDLD